jgi:uncharacterized membrane protein
MTLKSQYRHLKEYLGTSFWFLPLMIILAMIALATLNVWIDTRFEDELSEVAGFLFSGGPESARSILSTIAGGMLGVAGTVFSITLVVLTLATNSLGPRLLRHFMHDRLNQVVLGAYVATFVYGLLVLGTIQSDPENEFVPRLSILVGMTVAVANIFLLIVFIHHISVSIQADQVVSDVAENLDQTVRKLYPESMGQSPESESVDLSFYHTEYPEKQDVPCSRSGYVQSVDVDRLIPWCVEHDVWVELRLRPGDYAIRDLPIARLYAKQSMEPETAIQLEQFLYYGDKRTPLQDAEFAVHQVVEVAARALSPGVNDPYTAITCIDKLTSVLAYLVRAKFPIPYRQDAEGQFRVLARTLDFEGMLDAAFHQIRQFGASSPAVIIRLMDRLVTLYRIAPEGAPRKAILRHARMVHRAGENHLEEPNDRRDLRQRYLQFQEY